MFLPGDGGSLVFLTVILRVKLPGLIMGWPWIRVNEPGFNIDDSPQRMTVPILLAYDNRIMSVRDDARNRCLDTLHTGLITEDGAVVQSKPIRHELLRPVGIPQSGRVNSLNASVAAGIAMHALGGEIT
tara:strand:- start:906 stop:1292 length:387 start_codon:yes stop_codon:yes gene_type:complete